MNAKVGILLGSATLVGFSLLFSTAAPVAASPLQQEVKAAYLQKCASCHAPDGSGNTAYGKKNNLRDIRSKEVQALTDAKLYQIIAKGAGKMPGYEKSLGADMCKKLTTYMREMAK
jgi:mono/diheme cytochrome c family protein